MQDNINHKIFFDHICNDKRKLVNQAVFFFVRRVLILVLVIIATATYVLALDSEPRDFIIMKRPFRHLIASPLPTTPDGEVDVEKLFVEASMTTEPNLTPKMDWYLSGVILALRQEDVYTAKQYLKFFIIRSARKKIPMDINSVIQWALRQSYLESNFEESYYANKVKYYNDVKKKMRETVDEIRRQMNEYAPCGYGEISSEIIIPGTDCPPDDTCCDMEKFIALLEVRLQATVVDAELAEGTLLTIMTQLKLDRQNKGQQSLSSISKLMYETTMSIVQKAGGWR